MLERAYKRLLRWTVAQLNHRSDCFVTMKARPKSAQCVDTPGSHRHSGDFAVVMQGPVHSDFDFTLETLNLYRQTMPSALLVVSTWKDAPESFLAALAELGVKVVQPEKPEYPGILNVNMQLVSARAGVEAACAAGANWILKTRTDQRFYAPSLDSFLISLAGVFPPAKGTALQARVFGLGMGTLKFGLYHLTDQSVFGHRQEMLRYWGASLRMDKPKLHWPTEPGERFSEVPVKELFVDAAPESYLASQFLRSSGRDLSWTLADSWACFRDFFGVVDFSASDFYWVKNQIYTQLEDDRRYGAVDNRETLDFREWLLLYSGAVPADAALQFPDAVEGRFYDPVRKVA